MQVILIILLSIIGTIAMLFLCGCSRWSFIYLIRYRLLKMEIHDEKYTLNRKHDILSVCIAIITLVVVALLLMYGLPIVMDNIDQLPILSK